jgi:hypothetical protein
MERIKLRNADGGLTAGKKLRAFKNAEDQKKYYDFRIQKTRAAIEKDFDLNHNSIISASGVRLGLKRNKSDLLRLVQKKKLSTAGIAKACDKAVRNFSKLPVELTILPINVIADN